MTRWYLECYSGQGNQLKRLPVREFPFVVGRSDNVSFTIDATDVSRQHAEFHQEEGQLFVRDLSSTNGTFVNHCRINQVTPVCSGDVIHFAHIEARVVDEEDRPPTPTESTYSTMVMQGDLSQRIPLGARDLKELIAQTLVNAVFQPIVDIKGKAVAYELLGRGAHPNLLPSPGPLFNIAESVDMAVELSELFRVIGIKDAADHKLKLPLFVNTHPQELLDGPRLLATLEHVRKTHPNVELVLEIHEQAVTNFMVIQALAKEIRTMGIGLAYDDFGAGQARLVELAEAPPDVVKFDIALIRNIHKSPQRQELLELLVSMVHKMGVKALAEGVGSKEEAVVCQRMNFDLIQGFAFGYPMPITEWLNK
ncbi:EAL domain-containing protein [Hahella sp. KA22]|uniref:EAL domain-containing protein n=1 Tax=Hahella sp. KA22 TaxID=1628392 RepID=UPI000FDF1ED3|nr:EAL domain-containing protein [Hahella sp. KA22]AZZ94989.1 EAL domain-containing protein [Hahella sp. KA22]QAY52634.1 EAL domain-containing protein [Hahella sp. KA22]